MQRLVPILVAFSAPDGSVTSRKHKGRARRTALTEWRPAKG